jgi:hypothetical protein
VIDAIDATEPYKGGRGHALWQLNELNKPGKHHLTVATPAYYAGPSLTDIMLPRMRKLTGIPDLTFPEYRLNPAIHLCRPNRATHSSPNPSTVK